MIKIVSFVLNFLCISAIAVSGSVVRLEHFYPKVSNVNEKSLVKGGKFFANRCMSCHSLKLFTHDEIGELSGVTPDKMPNLDPQSWGGHPPPDLSLVARYKGVDWLYTYFHSFYLDAKQPLGVNNLVMPNTSMPNPYLDLQGDQVLAVSQQQLFKTRSIKNKPPWYRLLKLRKKGNVSHSDFNESIEDLVLFLDYVSEPKKQERLDVAPMVLVFLVLFFIVMFLLKKNIWKNISTSPS
jgi:ubiquinol-cytochrome c reductase cytochrome c1 subunit